MDDFVLLSAAWMLTQQVTTLDDAGDVVPDDGEYQRRGAEQVYVFAEFLRDKGLLQAGVEVARTAHFELRFSQLTEQGQRFARVALHKWMQSVDRAGPTRKIDARGLERRWVKFSSAGP
jgi:hypothetical protein